MKIWLTGSYFVENMRFLRKRYALSRRALARLAGISEETLRLMETEELDPVFESTPLRRIC